MTLPPCDVTEHHEVEQFLYTEAALLDEGRFQEWLALISPDVHYRMPVRISVARGFPDRRADMAHFDEDFYALTKRIERLETEHAWTENPPSRTRRFVTNIRAATDGARRVHADSYLLLFRSRGDTRPPEWVSAARRDVLCRDASGWCLEARDLTVDESVLRTQNLAVLL